MKAQQSPVSPGDVIAGKYRVESVLGVGGMGIVVAATHLDLLEPRALKFLLPTALENAEAVERFLREARAASRLKSEHVARVHDIGKMADGSPFMVMEYLDGRDLGATLKQFGAFPLETAVYYVLQAMDALAEAHANGIIHRDLKPANLFLTTQADGAPNVKILDFGISKITGPAAGDMDVTKTHAVFGSPHFMSPEQMRSARDVDARSDIWSLGVILYQLTTGRLPFRGRNLAEVVAVVFSGPPEPASSLAPHLPPGFDAVLHRCLRRDPEDRYGSVAELAYALAPFSPPAGAALIERIGRVAASFARKTGGMAIAENPTVVPLAPSSSPGVTPAPFSVPQTAYSTPYLPTNVPSPMATSAATATPLPPSVFSGPQGQSLVSAPVVGGSVTGAWGGTQAPSKVASVRPIVLAVAGFLFLVVLVLVVRFVVSDEREAATKLESVSSSPAAKAEPMAPPVTTTVAAPVMASAAAPVMASASASPKAPKKPAYSDPFGMERK